MPFIEVMESCGQPGGARGVREWGVSMPSLLDVFQNVIGSALSSDARTSAAAAYKSGGGGGAAGGVGGGHRSMTCDREASGAPLGGNDRTAPPPPPVRKASYSCGGARRRLWTAQFLLLLRKRWRLHVRSPAGALFVLLTPVSHSALVLA